MVKKYADSLVSKIKEKEYHKIINDVDILVKPIPDCNIPGAMDPRLYASTKKMVFLIKFMPKSLMKMDASPKSIARLRKMFNSVDSTPMVQGDIVVENHLCVTRDGYQMPIISYTPRIRNKNVPILYYIHGGGFFAGHHGVVEEAMKLLVEKTGIAVFSVDYRLAPENPYPTGHEDCYEGLKWVHENANLVDGDSESIFIAGDSAGGNLTQYCTNKALEDGLSYVKGQMLLYPTVNMGGVSDKYVDFDINKIEIYDKHAKAINLSLGMLGDSSSMLQDLLGTDDILNKYLTPYSDVSPNLPPTFLTVGEHDFLAIETLAYARKLVKAGVDTTTVLYKGLGHAYIDHVGNYPQSEDCIDEMGRFIQKYARK